MIPDIGYTAPPSVADAIGSLGRTEDVRFSPDRRRLAVAAFHRHQLAVFDVEIASPRGALPVALTGGVTLSSPALRWPHGLDFIDDDTLIVTSRGSDVAVFALPPGDQDMRTHPVLPLARWPANDTTLLNAPGSVAVISAEGGRREVLICNNHGHTVTKHLLDRTAAGAVEHSTVLLRNYLDIPDGVCVSPDRRWIAVANHTTHHVLLYDAALPLGADTEPHGILRRAYYPHGLRFSADGRHLFVADAGAPYLHVYAQSADGWRGIHHPLATVRIMDDAVFRAGRHNLQEGGAKGLDIDPTSGVLVVTSECQPLAFFDVPALLGRAAAGQFASDEQLLGMRYELSLMHTTRQLAEKARDAHAMQHSLSWRLTAPLRRLRAAFGGRASRSGSADRRVGG